MKKLLLTILLLNFSMLSQHIEFLSEPEIFLPDIICIDKTEVKITFSKDGNLILWGAIGRENGMGGFDIWQCERTDTGWSIPKPVSFNSADNDFDPCFSPDGKFVYFFSNRKGGFGRDDIYYAQYDSASQSFGHPINMGARFNTAGDEWGPSFSVDGKKFIYCTDGLKGKGKHDIFISNQTADGWSEPINLEALNSPEDDFDPVLLHDGKTMLFTKKLNEEEAYLYISYEGKEGFTTPIKINDKMNVSKMWNFGSSINPDDSSYIYYSTHFEQNTKGRLDIYRIKYKIK